MHHFPVKCPCVIKFALLRCLSEVYVIIMHQCSSVRPSRFLNTSFVILKHVFVVLELCSLLHTLNVIFRYYRLVNRLFCIIFSCFLLFLTYHVQKHCMIAGEFCFLVVSCLSGDIPQPHDSVMEILHGCTSSSYFVNHFKAKWLKFTFVNFSLVVFYSHFRRMSQAQNTISIICILVEVLSISTICCIDC